MKKTGIVTIKIGKPTLADTYGRGVHRVSVHEYDIQATSVIFEYYPDPSKDVLVLKIPMRYVSVINDLTGEEDAIKD